MSPGPEEAVVALDLDAGEVPQRLGDVLDLVLEGKIPVPSEAIPRWLRAAGVPIGIQKLVVLLQTEVVIPEEIDPLWVPVLMNVFKVSPNPTFDEAAEEFNRLAALAEAERWTPVSEGNGLERAGRRIRSR